MRSVPFRCANASKYLSLLQPQSVPDSLSRVCSVIHFNASLSVQTCGAGSSQETKSSVQTKLPAAELLDLYKTKHI